VAANAFEEGVHLLFATSLKASLGRTAFFVPGVDKTGTSLARDKLFTLAEADGIGTGTYQDQGNTEIALKHGAQRLNIAGWSDVSFRDWKGR